MNQSAIRRWAPWVALVVLFSIVTSLLSWWQFSRREERVVRIEQVLANYDKAPIPFAELDWQLDQNGQSQAEWTPVEVSGTYLPDQAVIVRNRPLSGQPGFLQLVPLQLSDGQILMVERGWLPAGSDVTKPQFNPLPQSGEHQLVVRIRAPEPDLGRQKVTGQLASINPAELSSELASFGEVITDRYGRLVTELPSYSETPIPMPMPSLNEGNHLSYALQWILFGLMAFGALIWGYRNDKRIRLEHQGLITPKVRKKTQSDLDNEFEDHNQ